MTITYTGDRSQMQKGANDTATCLGELENQLRALTNVQDLLRAAVKSDHTGHAIDSALGNAWTKGKALAGTLEQIVEQLAQSGVHVETQDLDGKARMLASDAMSGVNHGDAPSVGGWTGKIDTSALNSLT